MIDCPAPTTGSWIDLPGSHRAAAGVETPAAVQRLRALDAALDNLATAIGGAKGDAFRRIRRFLAKDPGRGSFRAVAAGLGDLRLLAILDRMFANGGEERRAMILDLVSPEDRAARLEALSLDRLARHELLRRIVDDGRVRALYQACAQRNGMRNGAAA